MLKINKKLTVLVAAIILGGCAGRTANPVMVQQYGDNVKSCAALEHDMAFIES